MTTLHFQPAAPGGLLGPMPFVISGDRETLFSEGCGLVGAGHEATSNV